VVLLLCCKMLVCPSHQLHRARTPSLRPSARASSPFILGNHRPTASLCLQTHIRLQVDLFSSEVFDMETVELYNADDPKAYTIDVIFTPKWQTPADVVYTSVSIPADARLTDLSGTASESIAPTSSAHRAGQPWFVFYRRDVFAAAKIAHPESMDDVLHAVRQLNGSDFNGDGVPDYSVCFNTNPGCVDSYLTFLGILGPMLQTAPSQGVFFQPDTMEPLVQNAAMKEALRIYATLFSCNDPGSLDPVCKQVPSKFSAGQYLHQCCTPRQRLHSTDQYTLAAGTCAVAFGFGVYQSSNAGWANVTGNIATGIFPGATRVLNRTSNTLQPCTKELCPLAVASAQTNQLVNFAPLYVVYRTQMLLAPTITGEGYKGMESLMQFMASQIPASYLTPLRKALGLIRPPANAPASAAPAPPAGSPASPFNLQPLVDIGYHLADTVSFLPAAFSATTHSNQLQDIELHGAAYFRCASAPSIHGSPWWQHTRGVAAYLLTTADALRRNHRL
jgi:hypothetical protein